MHSNALSCLDKYNKKKERVPDGLTIKYSQGIKNSCIMPSLASALYYMGDELASEYTLMGQYKEKNITKKHYQIQE